MARTEIDIDAPPERVWAVLADPRHYADWVVGAKEIRDADPAFPAPGTRFHHTVGFGPLTLKDHTEVIESTPPTHLLLHAKTRPLGIFFVDLKLARDGRGHTHVTMDEGPTSPIVRKLYNPLADLLVHGRNEESLRRLKEIAEQG